MKKIKFRQILVVILVTISMITLLLLLIAEHKRSIEDCVQGGHDRDWCIYELGK